MKASEGASDKSSAASIRLNKDKDPSPPMKKAAIGVVILLALGAVACAPRKSALAELLATETGRFSLRTNNERAPAESLEFEALREGKPHGVGIFVPGMPAMPSRLARCCTHG